MTRRLTTRGQVEEAWGQLAATELQHLQRRREEMAAGQASEVCVQQVEFAQAGALERQSSEPGLG